MVSCLKSLNHFDFIFVYGARVPLASLIYIQGGQIIKSESRESHPFTLTLLFLLVLCIDIFEIGITEV